MANIIKEKDTPFGKQYIVYEANGGMKTFSTREEAEAYQPTTKDPADNAANDLVFTALTLGANGVGKMLYEGGKKGLTIAGQAMTPSTWIGGISGMAGYEAPTALLNGADLAYSAYLGKQAGDAIAKDGLNLETGVNAALSLAPFTRSEEAIKAVVGLPRTIRDIQNSSNVINKARLAYEMNKGIKGAQFTNVPIEHVSPNGVTKGAALDVGQEGIHFSPAGSSTTPTIQKTMNYPYIRTGTWTYTNNTQPVGVTDVGQFRRGYNPDFDNKVDNGFFNFVYTNNFEGKGNTSYLTTQPSWGFQLSKNIQAPYKKSWNQPINKVDGVWQLPDKTKTPNLSKFNEEFGELKDLFQSFKPHTEFKNMGWEGLVFDQNGAKFTIIKNKEGEYNVWNPYTKDWDFFDNYIEARDQVISLRQKMLDTLPEEAQLFIKESKITPELPNKFSSNIETKNPELIKIMKESIADDIDQVYLSDEYIERFIKNTGVDPNIKKDLSKAIKYELQKQLNLTHPVLYKTNLNNAGASSRQGDVYQAGLNTHVYYNGLRNWDSTLFHEFGHGMYKNDLQLMSAIKKYNNTITKNIKNNVLPEANKTYGKQFIEYVSEPDEFRQRIMEVVRDGIKSGKSIEEMYDSKIMDKVALKGIFNEQFIKQMLSVMLSVPVLVNTNI